MLTFALIFICLMLYHIASTLDKQRLDDLDREWDRTHPPSVLDDIDDPDAMRIRQGLHN